MDDQIYPPVLASGRTRWSRSRRIAALTGAGAALMGSGVGIGIALTGGASAATSAARPAAGHAATRCARVAARLHAHGHPGAAAKAGAFCHSPALRLALRGGIHGEITYKGKDGFRTLVFERGTVESSAGQVLTVKAADGTTWTWHLVASSVVRESGAKVAASKLAAGEQVLVAGQQVSGANDARLIRIRPAS
jgi:hypothetical protein